MKASILSFRAAVLMVIAGIIWGIVMGISQDHSTMPAHAHLNLLGLGVSSSSSAFIITCTRRLTLTVLALVQVWLDCWHERHDDRCGSRILRTQSRRAIIAVFAACSCRYAALWLARFPPRPRPNQGRNVHSAA